MKILIVILSFIFFAWVSLHVPRAFAQTHTQWEFESIDTMKYSRDLSREKLNDSSFDKAIDTQVREIANTGATHVAIGTPYDDEFLPILKRWVSAARKYHLHVWFRGNFSGWEGWFDYPKISQNQHIEKTLNFILNNPDIFEDGDIFSSCPECENGGPGDPRNTQDVKGYRNFLITEYNVTKLAFQEIHKNVESNYFSMNGDVARLVMDPETTKQLDGIVTVDHYVATPEQLAHDIKDFAQRSGGKVVLGEFGAPIPDIHGSMTKNQQEQWIRFALSKLASIKDLVGVSYWVGTGGSTEIWDSNGIASPSVKTLAKFYSADYVQGIVTNSQHIPIANVHIEAGNRYGTITNSNGGFSLPYLQDGIQITFAAPSYMLKTIRFSSADTNLHITLVTPFSAVLSFITYQLSTLLFPISYLLQLPY